MPPAPAAMRQMSRARALRSFPQRKNSHVSCDGQKRIRYAAPVHRVGGERAGEVSRPAASRRHRQRGIVGISQFRNSSQNKDLIALAGHRLKWRPARLSSVDPPFHHTVSDFAGSFSRHETGGNKSGRRLEDDEPDETAAIHRRPRKNPESCGYLSCQKTPFKMNSRRGAENAENKNY